MAWYDPRTWDDESDSSKRKRGLLDETGVASNEFAEYAQGGYQNLTGEAQQSRDYLRQLASGQHSVSAEQLRQANQQTLAQQRSMAASASPQNSAMAARNAAMNMNRASMGLAGQQATAGLMERQAAQQALANMIMQQRQQDAQVALGSRGNAVSALGGMTPEGSTLDKWANPVAGGIAAGAKLFSDKRLKEDIEGGDGDADKALKGLRAFTYKYKNDKHGKGKQLGVMAQDLEKVGLKQAVIDTPEGKAVDVGKLSGANTAMLSALARRVEKLEGGKK